MKITVAGTSITLAMTSSNELISYIAVNWSFSFKKPNSTKLLVCPFMRQTKIAINCTTQLGHAENKLLLHPV